MPDPMHSISEDRIIFEVQQNCLIIIRPNIYFILSIEQAWSERAQPRHASDELSIGLSKPLFFPCEVGFLQEHFR